MKMAERQPFDLLDSDSAHGDVSQLPDKLSVPPPSVQLPLLRTRIEQYPSAKRTNPDVFCDHCDRFVSEKTYKKHQSLFHGVSDVRLGPSWSGERQSSVSQEYTDPGLFGR